MGVGGKEECYVLGCSYLKGNFLQAVMSREREGEGCSSDATDKNLYKFAKAAITNFNKLSGLNNRNLLSHNSGG